jgi:hypothetical protein
MIALVEPLPERSQIVRDDRSLGGCEGRDGQHEDEVPLPMRLAATVAGVTMTV